MTYFGFLARFLVLPILLLAGVAYLDGRQGRRRPVSLRAWPAWAATFLMVLIAVLYTTPWDNYLVATRVWWYDPALVTGFTIGWVPIEEYTFFVLQPILGALWLLALARRLPAPPAERAFQSALRWALPLALAPLWLWSLGALAAGPRPTTYLALELVWALPPIALQLGFGADILWRRRGLVFWALVPLTLYLSAVDALAIGAGTWTISPEQSIDRLIGGVLPFEEFLFFLFTNTLVVFGLVLLWAEASHRRLAAFRRRWVARADARTAAGGET